MHTFFTRILKNASYDTTRVFAGTAVSIVLGATGEFAYNKIKQPFLNKTLDTFPEISEHDNDGKKNQTP